MSNEEKLREKLQGLNHEEKDNLFVNYVRQMNGGVVPDGDGCVGHTGCGICVNNVWVPCG